MAGLFDTAKPLPIPEIGNMIINSQSDKVPFQKLVKRGKMPNQMLCSWPVESYPDRAFTGTLDGTDVSTYSHYTRSKMEAYAMLLRTAGVQVTKIANLTLDAGVARKQEIARQIMLDQKTLAIMRERQLLSTVETQLESGSDPYQSRGAFKWLSASAQAVKPVPAAFRPSSSAVFTGALDAFTATAFEAMLQAMAEQKRAPVDLKAFVGLKMKRAMSEWGQKATQESGEAVMTRFNLDAGDKKLVQIIDRFEFDSGVVHTLTSFYLACTEATGAASAYTSRSGLFVDTSMWEIGELQAPQTFQNPDLGGGPRAYTDCIYVLKCLNPIGQGYALVSEDETSA